MLNGGTCKIVEVYVTSLPILTLFLSFLPLSVESRYSASLTVALLAISQHPIHQKRLAVPLIIAGTTLFSGSIFALLLFKGQMGSLTKIVGPSTPVGGLLMIGGYLSLVGLTLPWLRQTNQSADLGFSRGNSFSRSSSFANQFLYSSIPSTLYTQYRDINFTLASPFLHRLREADLPQDSNVRCS